MSRAKGRTTGTAAPHEQGAGVILAVAFGSLRGNCRRARGVVIVQRAAGSLEKWLGRGVIVRRAAGSLEKCPDRGLRRTLIANSLEKCPDRGLRRTRRLGDSAAGGTVVHAKTAPAAAGDPGSVRALGRHQRWLSHGRAPRLPTRTLSACSPRRRIGHWQLRDFVVPARPLRSRWRRGRDPIARRPVGRTGGDRRAVAIDLVRHTGRAPLGLGGSDPLTGRPRALPSNGGLVSGRRARTDPSGLDQDPVRAR